MADYNRVSKGYYVDLLSQKGLQVAFRVQSIGPKGLRVLS